jgi:hypothetical protein
VSFPCTAVDTTQRARSASPTWRSGFVAVDVVGRVIVAVHLNGNDTVGVIGFPLTTIADRPPAMREIVGVRTPGIRSNAGTRTSFWKLKWTSTGLITIRVAFPCTCSATITGSTTSTATITYRNRGHNQCFDGGCAPSALRPARDLCGIDSRARARPRSRSRPRRRPRTPSRSYARRVP